MLRKSLAENTSPENFSASCDDNHSNWLADYRQQLGLTQEQLAEALGVTDRSVLNWEHGRHEPKLTIRQTKALCSILGIDLKDIPDEFPFYPKPRSKRRYRRQH